MLTIDKLYHLFKPLDNENAITAYPLIIGGGGGTLDLIKGGWIISPLRTKPLNEGIYDKLKLTDNGAEKTLKRLIQTDYQIDFFISPINKEKSTDLFNEVWRIFTYLKSINAILYLREFEAEILPINGNIQYFSEFGENKHLVNRAMFEFSIISKAEYTQDFKVFDKAKIIKSYLTDDNTLKLQEFKD